jgi:hypothetical protein
VQVVSGEMTKVQALTEFLNTWDTARDGSVNKDDFASYYTDISASIDDDDYFELMMRNAWHISGGQVSVKSWTPLTKCRVGHTFADELASIRPGVERQLGERAGADRLPRRNRGGKPFHEAGTPSWSQKLMNPGASSPPQVVELQNDLGLNPKNAASIRERLVQQGFRNIKRVSVADAMEY